MRGKKKKRKCISFLQWGEGGKEKKKKDGSFTPQV